MTKRRFSKEDWIALGLETLSAKGCDAVKLEAICTAAGMTRGSFYHHFEDHERFLTELARHWLKAQTVDVASAADPAASPDMQNAALTRAVMEIDYRLELGMRELGRRLPEIGEIIKQADGIRLDVVSGLYQRRFALDPATADNFAYLEYAAFSGMILLDPEMPAHRQKVLADLFDKTMARALRPETLP